MAASSGARLVVMAVESAPFEGDKPQLTPILHFRTDRVHTRVGSGPDFPYGITTTDSNSAALWLPYGTSENSDDSEDVDSGDASLLLSAATPVRRPVTASVVWKVRSKMPVAQQASASSDHKAQEQARQLF